MTTSVGVATILGYGEPRASRASWPHGYANPARNNKNSPKRVEVRRSQDDLVRIHDKPYVSRRKTDRKVVVVKVIVGLFVSR